MGRPSSKKDKESKSDRKFEKKLEFYAKVRNKVVSLSATKAIGKKTKLRSRQKKLKAYDLSSLNEVLPELNAKSQPETKLKLNSKRRQKLVEVEGKKLKAVLNNPAFKLNPFEAIRQHLESTQPAIPVEKPEKKLSKTDKKKKKKSKSSSGAQAMEDQCNM